MANFKVRTRGGASPKGKARVYFTCHPDDFDPYFETICEDIFQHSDCAVYYTANMSSALSPEEMELELGHMALFVVPVTYKLLVQPCRTMDLEIPFAKEHHIPILPLMQEPDLIDIYSAGDKFGTMQYFEPGSNDITSIPYAEKLKKYLDSVLLDDDTAARIRAAFAAYIFLSYRKKDRKLANELMRSIHSDPKFRDIAIWYDEFLIPGESFDKSIEKAIKDSSVFSMLVTPNILEEGNYIQTTEYPIARSEGVPILPVESLETDKNALEKQFEGIPAVVDGKNKDALADGLSKTLGSRNKQAAPDDAQHSYLIGLAYLDGVDVETDRERGASMIADAAEKGCKDAMAKLRDMYHDGIGVERNYEQMLFWAERYAEAEAAGLADDDPKTLAVLRELAWFMEECGKYQRAAELSKAVYDAYVRILGKDHPETIAALSALAKASYLCGDLKKALKLGQAAYKQSADILGEDSQQTLAAGIDLASYHAVKGEYKMAASIGKDALRNAKKIFGSEHALTLNITGALAYYYRNLGLADKAFELLEDAKEKTLKRSGDTSPEYADLLLELGALYKAKGDPSAAEKAWSDAGQIFTKCFGGQHPRTIAAYEHLAELYKSTGRVKEAEEIVKNEYDALCHSLGAESVQAFATLSDLGELLSLQGRHDQAAEACGRAFRGLQELYGPKDQNTIRALAAFAEITARAKEPVIAKELWKEAAQRFKETLGAVHQDTINAYWKLADICYERNEFEEIVGFLPEVVRSAGKLYGEGDLKLARLMFMLAFSYYGIGKDERALDYWNRSLDIYKRRLGPDARDTLRTRLHVGLCLKQLGKNRKAKEQLEAIYPKMLKVFGPADPHTKRVKEELEDL